MPISPLAGKPAPKELLIAVAALVQEYHTRKPDPGDPTQMVSFGTSGHRGTPNNGTFTESHILAITQAICDYRRAQGTTGPLYMGKDTHALSSASQRTALGFEHPDDRVVDAINFDALAEGPAEGKDVFGQAVAQDAE